MNSRVLIYDTSDFVSFPVGGQITSIKNFLHYLCVEQPGTTQNVILVGVTRDAEKIGAFHKIHLYGADFTYFPVALVESDLRHTGKSLRLEYLKGLLRYGKKLHISNSDCNYIHTPEAYGAIKWLRRKAYCVILSHGSYFNLKKGFRFFHKFPIVSDLFMVYVRNLLKKADLLFVLDEDTKKNYQKYNSNVVKICNSVVCPDIDPGNDRRVRKQVIFVGRLSKDKQVDKIIGAVNQLDDISLLVVGNGEEYDRLITNENERIHFVGAVKPDEVKDYLRQADILVMNSVFEGIPMTILEAISYGLPVVTTDVGGIGEVLVYGEDSEKTDGTEPGMIHAIKKIYADYDKYSDAAYRNSKKYDYIAVNSKIYGYLSSYLEG